ncbi:ABC transporter ATP-binding protein [Mobilicoccus pelagius]|uniref:Putative ABC transporter ATP-binding protein n=1 Tax=Mobilicoccus pelagius NBRC 104925 TaxID=1089455 RepID=H5US55_9MICO|nr:ATP-binding cassette domain-containing protein [Mobilicoccus pelagius]GAB48563.1 putative ABC transporter ATP-binding protein [Mobilicoccus pelagius NBRC 104925]
MTPVIETRSLTREFHVRTPGRRFGRTTVTALSDLTITVDAGEAVGYIGANGAGKSTTIKMLTGILTPTAGEVRTCGLDPMRRRRDLARRIGVVFGQRSQLWWDLPLRDTYPVLAAIHGLPTAEERRRTVELVDALDLGAFLDTPVRQLSLGQRMRGELAAALLHSPELVILDEPTIGLDVLSKAQLREFLRAERAARGTTLLLTTHDMSDIEHLCERVLLVDSGRLAHDGDLASLARTVGAKRVLVVDLATPHPRLPVLTDGAGAPLTVDHVGSEGGGLRHRFAFDTARTSAAAVLTAVSAHAEVRDLAIEEPDIEDVVRHVYSAGLSGA